MLFMYLVGVVVGVAVPSYKVFYGVIPKTGRAVYGIFKRTRSRYMDKDALLFCSENDSRVLVLFMEFSLAVCKMIFAYLTDILGEPIT